MKRLRNERDAAPESNATLERLFELTVLLGDIMDRGLAERGLSRARAEVIWELNRQGPLTQRHLSQALRCTPRNVTGLLDALEASGLVARGPHPTDRRATLASLTAHGRKAAKAWETGYRRGTNELFADLSRAELAQFRGALDKVLARLRTTPTPDGGT